VINGERETIRSVPDFKTSSISQSYLATIYRNFYQTAGKIKKGLANSASMPGSTNNSPPTQQLRFSDHMNLTRSDSGGALLFQSQNAVFTVKQMFENFDKEILCANTWGTYQSKILVKMNKVLMTNNRKPNRLWYNGWIVYI
jgi:hypothetical protein